jgi:hypothetical protein
VAFCHLGAYGPPFFLSLDHFLFGHRHRQGSHQRRRLKSKDLDEPEIFLDFLGRGGNPIISYHKHHAPLESIILR